MSSKLVLAVTALLLSLSLWQPCQAQQLSLNGKWFHVSAEWKNTGTDEAGLIPIQQPEVTGGHFLYRADFEITQNEMLVVDFKNSSVIGRFHHRIFNDLGQLMAEMEGGIQSESSNPFFLRHGRELTLPFGHYHLDSEIESPFLLAQPEPYLDTQEHYRQAIKPGNALVLLCLGLLLGLAFYYTALAVIRRNVTDILYVLFILGNLLYNGTALLVYPELFGMHWFYLISLPILFSNIAYVFFVARLLDITKNTAPRLYRIGAALVILFMLFILLALIKPNWSLEFDRLGVGLFLSFGLGAGIVRARQGQPSAKMYLVAVIVFFMLGTLSIILNGLSGIYTFYVEHLGLLAVTVEALLLALVLARQFEQLRKEKEKAITDSFDKSRFLAAASHDLRQPMHALGLFVGELQAQVTMPQQVKLVKLIDESVNAMSSLLDSLLDVSKLDAGLIRSFIRPFPIADLLDRMEQEYVPLAAKHGVILKVRPCSAHVESDLVLLERILLNLLGNAIRYTPQGGRVLLTSRRRGQRLRIEIRDNGIGIPLDKQQDIFREFVQLGNVERSREKGLGLGLSIVQRLCNLLQCPLDLRSMPGKGSVFAVEIPLFDAAVHTLSVTTLSGGFAPDKAEKEEFLPARVLVVEDDPLVQASTRQLLASWGYEVEAAASLAQAQQLFPLFSADLLICDYRLPDGTAPLVIQAAEQFYGRKLPCILVSGDTAPEIMKDAQVQGWHMMHKPVKAAKLHSLVLFELKRRSRHPKPR